LALTIGIDQMARNVRAGSDASRRSQETTMSWLEWTLGIILVTFYIMCLFTVCMMTFQKGRNILGIIGIFFPFLWLIGAFLPAKPGSRWELSQQMAARAQVQQYSQ
jgi:hypothetical protein